MWVLVISDLCDTLAFSAGIRYSASVPNQESESADHDQKGDDQQSNPNAERKIVALYETSLLTRLILLLNLAPLFAHLLDRSRIARLPLRFRSRSFLLEIFHDRSVSEMEKWLSISRHTPSQGLQFQRKGTKEQRNKDLIWLIFFDPLTLCPFVLRKAWY